MAEYDTSFLTGTRVLRQEVRDWQRHDREVLELLFSSSRALQNQANYLMRQTFFHRHFIPKKDTLFFREELKPRGWRDGPLRKLPIRKGETERRERVVRPLPHPWTVPLRERFVDGSLKAAEGSWHRKFLPSPVTDQVLHGVHESWESYRALLALWKKGELPDRPGPPGYLDQTDAGKLTWPNSGGGKPKVIMQDGVAMLRLPLGDTLKLWFGLPYLFVPVPVGIDAARVREWTLRKRYGEVYLDVTYFRDRPLTVPLDPEKKLALDPGTSANLLAGISNGDTNLLIDARKIKSFNQGYNRLVAKRKQGKPEGYWDGYLDDLTRKRNDRLRDGINKAAKLVIHHCLQHGIGTVVFGWNRGIKTGVQMGSKENQKFVQMPLSRLKDRVRQLCGEHGITFHEQEESYTSKSSFLDGDTPPTYGDKPGEWAPSGRRTKRGLYRTASGELVNADLNGAANILLKHLLQDVTRNLSDPVQAGRRARPCPGGAELCGVTRRSLTTARRTFLWARPGRKNASASHQGRTPRL